MKLLSAQIISFAFLMLFLRSRPYRKSRHYNMQAISMAVPTISLGWALAGLAPVSDTGGGTSAADSANAGTLSGELGIVLLHIALLVPFVVSMAIAVVSTASVLWAVMWPGAGARGRGRGAVVGCVLVVVLVQRSSMCMLLPRTELM